MTVMHVQSQRPSVRRWARPGAQVWFTCGALAGGMVVAGPGPHLLPLVRAAVYGCALTAVGAALFLLIADRGTPRQDLLEVGHLAMVAAAGCALATLAQVGIQVVEHGGEGWAGLADRRSIDAVVSGNSWVAAVARVLGVHLLTFGMLRRRERAGGADPGLTGVFLGLGGLVVLASFALTGHAVTRTPRALGMFVDVVHLATASVWVGGLVGLACVLRHRWTAGDAIGGAAIVRRFSQLMVVTIALLLGSGVTLGWMELGGPGGLVGSAYGGVLLMKIGVVAALLGVGTYNHLRLVPSVAAGGWQTLRRSVQVELVLLGVVIAVTAVLAGMSPA